MFNNTSSSKTSTFLRSSACSFTDKGQAVSMEAVVVDVLAPDQSEYGPSRRYVFFPPLGVAPLPILAQTSPRVMFRQFLFNARRLCCPPLNDLIVLPYHFPEALGNAVPVDHVNLHGQVGFLKSFPQPRKRLTTPIPQCQRL